MTYQDNLEQMLSETMVKDVMTKALVLVDPTTTLYQISKMMDHMQQLTLVEALDEIK